VSEEPVPPAALPPGPRPPIYSAAGQELLDQLSNALKVLPGPIRSRVGKELEKLQELVLEQRPPRLLIVGRRGSGKSSLINAIFRRNVAAIGPVRAQTGKGTWYTYREPHGELQILDTRGFGESSRPESAEYATAEEEILAATLAEAPDALLFLCKAKEIDARIEEDIRSMLTVQRQIEKKHGGRSPIVGLVTQVDELDPVRIGPPFDHPQKMANIEEACEVLRQAFAEAGQEPERIIPIATYLEFDRDEIVDQRLWNLDLLLEYLVEVLPASARLVMARTTQIKAVQKQVAQELVKATTVICAGIAAVPIPLADTLPLTAAQIAMISSIGYLSGRSMTRKTATEFISAMGVNVGAGLALRELARGLVKLIPGAGSVVSAAVAGAGTWALGQAAILYFIEGRSAGEAKQRFEAAKNEKPADLPPAGDEDEA
jgi:predicted GTPase